MSNFKKLSFLLHNEGIRLKVGSGLTYRILKFFFKSDVYALGRTITIPEATAEWLNSNYAFATIAHEYTHYLDKRSLGLKYYLKWWFSDEERFELEIRAYAVNILCGLVLNGRFDFVDEKVLINILYNNYSFDYTVKELADRVSRVGYLVRGVLKTEDWCNYTCSEVLNSPGFKNVYDILARKI